MPFACPRCGSRDAYELVKLRRWQCTRCRYQVSLTAGTILHNTKTPLTVWFSAAYLMTTDKPKEIKEVKDMAVEQTTSGVSPIQYRTGGARAAAGYDRNGRNHAGQGLAKALGWFSVGLGVAEVVMPGLLMDLIGTRQHRTLVRSLGARDLANGIGVLTSPRSPAWIWARVGGDLVDLGLIGVALARPRSRRGKLVAAAAAVGGVTALDLICGQRLSREQGPARITRSITIKGSPSELYDRWQDAVPQIMGNFAEVNYLDRDHAHWAVRLPMDRKIEWDTEIVERRPGELLRWRTTREGRLRREGSVSFRPAPRELGTEVTLDIRVPGVGLGAIGGKLLGSVPAMVAEKALRRFKSLVETGEMPTVQRAPSGRSTAQNVI